tara:strand:+ start:47 stop:388 length:342 start_codon:yes stop_codon:yes gene_type:complete
LYSFKQRSRIKNQEQFKYVFSVGKKFYTKGFIIYLVSTENSVSSYGFIAGKKVGNAVKRNRSKRLLREIVRLNQSKLIKGYNMVLIAKHLIFNYSFEDLNVDFLTGLAKLDAL